MIENTFPEQVAFGTNSFADNPEPRCPCLLLLDTSGSMQGKPIDELNNGINIFKNELLSDLLAMKRVEVALITFGPIKVVNTFCSVSDFTPPTLSADGDTPMGSAISRGIEMIKQRKNEYKAEGISYYRPWIFLITDGAPTDEWQAAANQVHEGENNKSFAFFAVGVGGANLDVLKQISVREPLMLQGLKFTELFQWLSSSMKTVSQSTPGSSSPIDSPIGWAQV